MTVVVAALGAIVPSLLLLWYFYKRDLNPEPRSALLRTFFLGVLTVIPVLVIALPLLLLEPQRADPLLVGLYSAFLMAAIPEELCKFWVVTRYSARHPAFNEPMDGVVYGAVASLGFATLENVLYVAVGGWTVALLRAFTAVPSHAFCGAILGYYVAKARFNPALGVSAWRGFGIVVLLHGLYDWPLLTVMTMHGRGLLDADPMADRTALLILSLLVLWVIVVLVEAVWALRLIRRLRREQEQLAAGKPAEVVA